jgi:hypothetical protein
MEQGNLQGILQLLALPSQFGIESVCKFNMLQRNSLHKKAGNFCLPSRENRGPEQGILELKEQTTGDL